MIINNIHELRTAIEAGHAAEITEIHFTSGKDTREFFTEYSQIPQKFQELANILAQCISLRVINLGDFVAYLFPPYFKILTAGLSRCSQLLRIERLEDLISVGREEYATLSTICEHNKQLEKLRTHSSTDDEDKEQKECEEVVATTNITTIEGLFNMIARDRGAEIRKISLSLKPNANRPRKFNFKSIKFPRGHDNISQWTVEEFKTLSDYILSASLGEHSVSYDIETDLFRLIVGEIDLPEFEWIEEDGDGRDEGYGDGRDEETECDEGDELDENVAGFQLLEAAFSHCKNLEEIDLSGDNVTEQQFNLLRPVLSRCQTLRVINVSCDFSGHDPHERSRKMNAFGTLLSSCRFLQILRIIGQKLIQDDYITLGNHLANCNALHTLKSSFPIPSAFEAWHKMISRCTSLSTIEIFDGGNKFYYLERDNIEFNNLSYSFRQCVKLRDIRILDHNNKLNALTPKQQTILDLIRDRRCLEIALPGMQPHLDNESPLLLFSRPEDVPNLQEIGIPAANAAANLAAAERIEDANQVLPLAP